jgi:hypothetical protein
VTALAAVADIGLDVDAGDQAANFRVVAAFDAAALDAFQIFIADHAAGAAIGGVAGQIGAGAAAAFEVARRAARIGAGPAVRLVGLQIDALAAAALLAGGTGFLWMFLAGAGQCRRAGARQQHARQDAPQEAATGTGLTEATGERIKAG